MKILLTNDDGYRAEPYQRLGAELQKQHDVFLISPENNCSGISHAFTLTQPVFLRPMASHENPLGLKNFHAFSGTPVDCVKFSLVELFKDNPPDLVISGINHGANVGIDVLYSGTVAAAIEGYINGCSSIALSHYAFLIPNERILEIADWLNGFLEKSRDWLLEEKRILNINYPDCPRSELKGTRITRTGKHGFTNSYDRRSTPHGRDYYWLHGEMVFEGEVPDSDKKAMQDGYVSVTPLKIDYTDTEEMDQLSELGF